MVDAGYSGDKLKKLLWQIEPTRIAHRLCPQRTWLYSARQDTVVPMENALALAKAAKLPDEHHHKVDANHYSAILYYTKILKHMAAQIHRLASGE